MRRALPVSVTGMGCVCAAGTDLSGCLTVLAAGHRAPAIPARFGRAAKYPVFEVPPGAVDAWGKLHPGLSRTVHLALHAAREALSQSGLDLSARPERIGVCIGTSVGASLNFLDYYRTWRQGENPGLEPIRRYLDSSPAMAVARLLGVSGPVQTVTNACSSGADALGLAAAWIRQGLCDAAVAGGADELSVTAYNGFARLMITDEEPCRPFDRSRRGLNLGEGAGMIILESAESAARRGAVERGTILGYGTASDAYHLTAPHPGGRGLRGAIAAALAQAGLAPEDMACINAHGTATRDNDRAEAAVFGTLFPHTPFIATKGMTGHTLGAAGAIEAVFAMAHLAAGELPASAGYAEPDPELGVSPAAAGTEIRGAAALSLSLAFGGNNSALVVGRGKA